MATHLARALKRKGFPILCIASRSEGHAREVAEMVDARATADITSMPKADVTIISTSDNAIGSVAQQLAQIANPSIVVHTSGSTPLEALEPIKHRGILYPCMTFSKADEIDISKCPFLIEAADEQTLGTVRDIAKSIGASATECDSEGRARLHLAAVLASNFTNHLLLQSQRILERANLPLGILQPLVAQTIDKAFRMNPKEAQTGPARRGDTKTLDKHRKIIGDNGTLMGIYDSLTKAIEQEYDKNQ